MVRHAARLVEGEAVAGQRKCHGAVRNHGPSKAAIREAWRLYQRMGRLLVESAVCGCASRVGDHANILHAVPRLSTVHLVWSAEREVREPRAVGARSSRSSARDLGAVGRHSTSTNRRWGVGWTSRGDQRWSAHVLSLCNTRRNGPHTDPVRVNGQTLDDFEMPPLVHVRRRRNGRAIRPAVHG